MEGHGVTDWPNVCVVLLTYDRLDYAERTIARALSGIRYSGRISCHIGDDGSPPGYRERLVEIAGSFDGINVSVSNSERAGYGGSYNQSTMVCHTDNPVILPLEDDWELLQSLDIDPLVLALMDPEAGIGCIRLGYIGFTQELRGTFVESAGKKYLLLDPRSPEPHVFSGHPRLETREWARRVGPWPEHMGAGATEFAVAHRPAARRGVAWPVDLALAYGSIFGHFGAIKARDD